MLNSMVFPSSFSDSSDELTRAYDPNDIQGASYRILKDLGRGEKLQDVLNTLGRRQNDPEHFARESVLKLVDEIRLFLSKQISQESPDLNDGLMHIGQEVHQVFPEADFSPEQIAIAILSVRDRLKNKVNHCRIRSHRFPF